jgi:dTDP-4-amino-4,6-dideoxygalactose transaminase
LAELVAERRRNVERLRQELRGLAFPVEPEWARSNWQSLCVRLPSGIEAARVIGEMEAQGIAVRPAIGNAHQIPEYRADGAVSLPESERAQRECILLPLPSRMTDRELAEVVEAARAATLDRVESPG